eukprot:4876629-Ditylum_brightwellii.AAC.1
MGGERRGSAPVMGGTVGTLLRSSSRRRGKVDVASSSAFWSRYDLCQARIFSVFLIICWGSGLIVEHRSAYSLAIRCKIMANISSQSRGVTSLVGGTLALAVHNAIAGRKPRKPLVDVPTEEP